jgi:hypothetical protein
MYRWWTGVSVGVVLSLGSVGLAGVPLNNLEGVGGIAFNPLAYPGGNGASDPNNKGPLGLPQFGAWYMHLGDVDIDWTTIGIAETLFDRVELSYGREIVGWSEHKSITKNNLGAKLLVIPEEDVIPAVSVGGVWKSTTFDVPADVEDSGYDIYAVATKLIKALPQPVLLSGGAISTEGRTLGVLGFDDDRDTAFFGNVDVLPLDNVAVGFEYRQGAEFDQFKNADYWNAHGAWFVNPNLTLVAAYVDTGDETATDKVGLGEGVVFSVQYGF